MSTPTMPRRHRPSGEHHALHLLSHTTIQDDTTLTLMAGAMRLGEEAAEQASYMDGWRWGLTCGICLSGLIGCVAMAIGAITT